MNPRVPPSLNSLPSAANFGLVGLLFLLTAGCQMFSNHGKTEIPRDGLVALWSGEDNCVDSVTGDVGVNENVTFTNGVAGRAFAFAPNSYPYGTYTGVRVADRPEFVLTNSLTIEGWVRPRGDGYIIFWRGDNRPGMDPFTLSMEANDHLNFNICGDDGANITLATTLPYYQWTHVAATLDGLTGTMCLYTNGQLAVRAHTSIHPIGELIPDRSPGVGIGNLNDGSNTFPFNGDVDEIALYSRALSWDEIWAIYQANAAHVGNPVDPLPSRGPFHSEPLVPVQVNPGQ